MTKFSATPSLPSEEHLGSDRVRSEILAAMSPGQKWQIVCEMRATAMSLKRARIRQQNPDWSNLEIEAELKRIFLYATT